MEKHLIAGVLMLLSLTSCVEQKFIVKDNYISRNNTSYKYSFYTLPDGSTGFLASPTDSLYIYKVKSGFRSKIENRGDFIVLQKVPSDKVRNIYAKKQKSALIGTKSSFNGKYYYPDLDTLPKMKFTYIDSKPVLQGLSIPLKIRAKIADISTSQTETGFNPSLAFGWKFNINRFSPEKDIFGKNLTQLSLTPGIFLGTGAVDLKKSNTHPIIQSERKAAIVSSGLFIMFGYNNINFGYSVGWDFATGEGSRNWQYHGRMWHGLSVGFDIIK